MTCFVILAIFITLTNAANALNFIPFIDHVSQGRIISGSPAAVGQFPWQAAVLSTVDGNSYSFCGGALISNQWVLTAAHCASGTRRYIIYLGGIRYSGNEAGRIELRTTTAIPHPNYNTNNLNNDIALIKLTSPIQFTRNIQPIRLPARGNRVGVNQMLTVSGWGKTSDSASGISSILNFVTLRSISNADCASLYGSSIIISSTLCCSGHPEHSTCSGDSGGPLVSYTNGVATHVGVVSFVPSIGCARGFPSGYVRTESFLDWIRATSGVTS